MENFLRAKKYCHLVESGTDTTSDIVVLTKQQRERIDEQKMKDLKVSNYLFGTRSIYFGYHTREGDLPTNMGLFEKEI